ncbi:MAG: hypothetical protein DWQ36_17675 [Acidobacteria bacterium]|nr:MAG: hypothetical protein DWQ30_15875 [Acidobacteriota bacterium]REK04270.1 MAG: hypothetical protein DWQ36_17675 [Acidobacteriota bacterium]
MKSRTQSSRFAALLLPAIVLQSMIVGGGYATGREIVQYAGRFGPAGWWAVLVIFVGFSGLSILAFEVARTSKAYDYRSWITQLIGPLWPLFDLLMLSISMLVLAVMTAAIGSTLQQTLGLAFGVGVAIAFVTVGLFVALGAAAIERMKTVGSVLLYGGYVLFSVRVLTAEVATGSAAQALPPEAPTLATVLLSGLLYVGYNLAIFPAVLFCLHRQARRRETMIAGLVAGLLITVPFVLTFVCLMRFWPDPQVFEAPVPWLVLLSRATDGSPLWAGAFGLVAGWTLIETAVGSIHALTSRVEHNLQDLPARLRPRSGRLGHGARFAMTIAFLVAAAAMAQFGIVDLVAKGYGAMAWGFIVLLALPLLVVGTRRMLTREG